MRDFVLFAGVLILSLFLMGVATQYPGASKLSSPRVISSEPRYLELKSVRATTIHTSPPSLQMREPRSRQASDFKVEERKMRSRLTKIDTQCADIDAILQRLESSEEKSKAHGKSSKVR